MSTISQNFANCVSATSVVEAAKIFRSSIEASEEVVPGVLFLLYHDNSVNIIMKEDPGVSIYTFTSGEDLIETALCAPPTTAGEKALTNFIMAKIQEAQKETPHV